jgi:hypothetical protein
VAGDTQQDAVRIAMWSGPRNISTAMMRAFENRADTMVVDEPFYACFLKETGIDHPGRDLILREQPDDWRTVANALNAPLPAGVSIFYQKHMCHHMLPSVGLDWMQGMRHAFLVRDPRRLLASYVKSRPDVTLADIGVERQYELFQHVAEADGTPPPVIDTADVLSAPAERLTALCARLGIPFDAAMLSWPKGKRDSDGVWAPWWYENVENSTGFDAGIPRPIDEVWNSLDDRLKGLAEEAMPYYEALSRHKIA